MYEISPIPSENLNDLHDIMTLMTHLLHSTTVRYDRYLSLVRY